MKKFTILLLLLCVLFVGCSDADVYKVSNDTSNPSYNTSDEDEDVVYIVNMSSKSYHLSNCHYVKIIKSENMEISSNSDMLREKGYRPCSRCVK